MNAPKTRSAKWQRRLIHPPRAVIDIGSNTVRLVIYEGTARAPEVVWNENVAARLGRDLSTTGRIPEEAMEEALTALARYALIVEDRGIDDVQTVATAAARDAENGGEFLERVAALGLEPRLLSGEEEAVGSAMGAIGAFPGAKGVVLDLGGGSLEVVSVAGGECHDAVSLPFGTLRLPMLVGKKDTLKQAVRDAISNSGIESTEPGPLYMVGGTWRALAHYAMRELDYPLTDPHGFTLSVKEARRIAKSLVDASPAKLETVSGISAMRAGYLPNAAALLLSLLKEFDPEKLVFSSWGIREGLLFSQLTAVMRAPDPLLSGVHLFAEQRDASVTDAAHVAGWTVELTSGKGLRNERLRLAAAQLAAALQRVEPNLRADHALEWSLGKRWIDCSPRDRAMLCAALYGSLGIAKLPEKLSVLARVEYLEEALNWGFGLRLARRLGAGSQSVLALSRLRVKKKSLVLYIDDSRAALVTAPLMSELEILAQRLGRKPKLRTGDYEFNHELLETDEEE